MTTDTKTTYPDLLRLTAEVTQGWAEAPSLCGIEVTISHEGSGVNLHLASHGDAAGAVAWADYLGGRLRLRQWTTGDSRVITECAAVREIEGTAFRVWTHIPPEQAGVLLRLAGGIGSDGRAWLPVDNHTASVIAHEFAAVLA